MKGFFKEEKLYCTKIKVAKYSSKVVEAFMITDYPEIIANRINHREHFERAYASTSFEGAMEALRKKVPTKKLKKFGISDESQINVNVWYHKQ